MKQRSLPVAVAISFFATLVGAQPAETPPTGTFEPAEPAAPPPTEPPPTQPTPAEPVAPAAPPAAPAPAQPPAAAPPAFQEQPPAPPPPYVAAEAQAEQERSGLVLVTRFGFVLGGGGEAEQECEGSATICGALSGETNDYDDESDPLLGVDLLGHLSHNLRLGAGLTWVTGTAIDIDGFPNQQDLGSDLSLMAIVEGVLDLGSRTAIVVRGQGGVIFLFAGGDLENEIEGLKDDCSTIEDSGGSCEVKDGPFVGWTVGGGAGIVHALESVAVRADFLLQFHGLRTAGQDVSIGGEDVETTFVLTGNRFLLTAGLEF